MLAATTTLAGTADIEDLSRALRAHAKGALCAEAAVELLVKHRSWVVRADFVSRFVDVFDGIDGTPMAFVDWTEAVEALSAGELACSSSEGQILRIAASIAEGVPVDLSIAMCTLDATNAARVARALLHASGHAIGLVIERGQA